ncbi:MAG: SOS response-associated peptidase [Alphaproteobacteria bacterium]
MCGRFSLTTAPEAMRALFEYENFPNLEPRYNIAPTQQVAVVRSDGDGGGRALSMLRWGLVPHWAKDISIGARMINARAETVASKPAFRDAFAKRRCLIIADGFFEWRTEDGAKQPFRIGMKGGAPFAFAGLWESWSPAEGASLETVTIITTAANDRLHPIHHRMPVILAAADYAAWLDVDGVDGPAAQALLKPYPAEPMAFYRVNRAVNNARNDNPDCIEPLAAAG